MPTLLTTPAWQRGHPHRGGEGGRRTGAAAYRHTQGGPPGWVRAKEKGKGEGLREGRGGDGWVRRERAAVLLGVAEAESRR